MQIALKVDIDTYRGTLIGIPRLLKLFGDFNVRATFFFSLGPDHTGRAIRRVMRPGFLSKVQRTSVTEHYGFKTLLYGVLLPGPHIGRKAAHLMRAVRDAGHEVGIHCYDHVRWQDFVASRDEKWTRREFDRAVNAFVDVFDAPPTTHGAAGWQLNSHLLRAEEDNGFHYASDTRGRGPFLPDLKGIEYNCVQIPTTLPTLDELIGRNHMTADNVDETVFLASREPLPHGHVYTLHAELEGMKLLPVMEQLLNSWREAGDDIVTMDSIYQSLDAANLPRKEIVMGEIEGRSGRLAVEANE